MLRAFATPDTPNNKKHAEINNKNLFFIIYLFKKFKKNKSIMDNVFIKRQTTTIAITIPATNQLFLL
jgi:hypothetical protein